ncbi:hypothetical protein FEM48_ZijujUnG0107900 [Ziziphus jujuba var. spinosa]|uniref:Embryo defective 2759 n=1 Tax=Ziziphus jujuba var. spinosa TaxID=714518 RepID=A0A978U843_ZIZJJ|nr:hypothetical protein FEM48_ZijujUnG0107900 [Ziziphus jujuba var. spinosa]
MALVTHQMQGSYVTLPSKPSWSKGMKLKHYVKTLYMVGRTDRSFLLKRNSHLSVGTSCMCGLKPRTLRILAFKGSAQGESGGRACGPKVSKKSVKLKENEDTVTESPKTNEVPIAYASEANESIASSPAIHGLFKKWLAILRTQSSSQMVDGILGEEPPPREISEMEHVTQDKGRSEILKAVWRHCLSLDATIKIPLMIFIPGYLAVNMMYGAEVSKELTPLWVLGPLIVALYVKLFQWLFALYVFSFKQTVKVIKNLPTYYMVAYSYISKGKLKKDLHSFWQPVENIKNLNYKELSKRKLKELEGWIVERYLDFVESIWPYYCRTIRFLKRANLI